MASLPNAPKISPRLKSSDASNPRSLKASDKSLTKKHIGYSYDNDDLPHHPEFGVLVLHDADPLMKEVAEEERDQFSDKITSMMDVDGLLSPPGILTRTRTSSELLSQAAESAMDDQDKIANFISQLKAGEVTTKPASDFRTRRLTFAQQTQLEEALALKQESVKVQRNKGRTSIFASSEIGVVQEKRPPFPDENLGTYSCHGIEPDVTSDTGIHEKINQDRGCVVYPYNSSSEECLFAVLDGHGEHGDKVSEFTMRQVNVIFYLLDDIICNLCIFCAGFGSLIYVLTSYLRLWFHWKRILI